MELKILKSFVAVAKARSFSAAARELNTVQPAISRHVSDLEEELGVQLLWRNTREVKITPAGESLLRDAKEMLAAEIAARESAKQAASGVTGRLRIGYLPPACFCFIPDLVRTYSSRYPGVKISLQEMTVRQQVEAFAAGKLDVGFSRPLSKAEGKGFLAEELYIDTLIGVLPENHPLGSAKSLSLIQLEKEPFILFSRNEAQGLFDQIIGLCQKEKFAPVISSQPVYMQTVLTKVAAGLGVSIMPGCVKKMYTRGCVFVPIQKQKPSIPTQLHYRSDPILPTVKDFVSLTIKARQNIQRQMLE